MNPLAHIDLFGTIILPLICLILPGSFFLAGPSPCRSIRRTARPAARYGLRRRGRPGHEFAARRRQRHSAHGLLLSLDPTRRVVAAPSRASPAPRRPMGMVSLPLGRHGALFRPYQCVADGVQSASDPAAGWRTHDDESSAGPSRRWP